MTTELDPWLTMSEAAERLGIHRRTLREWANKGLIEHHRIGPAGHRRFRLSAVDACLRRSRSAAAPVGHGPDTPVGRAVRATKS